MDGNVYDVSRQPRDGDAGYLGLGTILYTIKGYQPSFRLAARRDGSIVMYEADENPSARTGSDLLDIQGKVKRIVITSHIDGTTEIGAITDARRIATLVDVVLQAPVDQQQLVNGPDCFIVFQLADGTVVRRAYTIDLNVLARGIKLPDAFRTAMNEAVPGVRPSTQPPDSLLILPTPRPVSTDTQGVKLPPAGWLMQGNSGTAATYGSFLQHCVHGH